MNPNKAVFPTLISRPDCKRRSQRRKRYVSEGLIVWFGAPCLFVLGKSADI